MEVGDPDEMFSAKEASVRLVVTSTGSPRVVIEIDGLARGGGHENLVSPARPQRGHSKVAVANDQAFGVPRPNMMSLAAIVAGQIPDKKEERMFTYRARLVRVIDGDSVELDVDLGFHVTVRDHFRLSGINAPELHSTSLEERTAAKASSAFLTQLLTKAGSSLVIKTEKSEGDKYGRWLVQIFASPSPQSLNEQMIAGGFAKAYGGGAKPPFSG